MASVRLSHAFRSIDLRALLHDRNAWRAATATAIVVLVVLSATWTMKILTGARQPQAAEAMAAMPAPVLTGLAPKQRLRTRTDTQPVAFSGTHLVDQMSVTISAPDDRVATYGSHSITNVTPTGFTLRAIFDVPGTYHLVVRNPDGTRSNEITVPVGK
jgi:hypothetical protein